MDRLADAAETSGRAGSLLEIRMLQALAHDAQGHRQQALQSLDHAWAGRPSPKATCGSSWTRALPWSSCCVTLQSNGATPAATRVACSGTTARDGEATESPQHRALTMALPSAELLSERELQVLRLLNSELTGPQIARELFVSNNTLRTHTKHIFTKLNVTSRRAAVRRAREEGLI